MEQVNGNKSEKESGRTQREVQDEGLPEAERTACCLMESRAKKKRAKRRRVSDLHTDHCIQRALAIRRRLDSGIYASDAAFARKHRMEPARVCQLLSLLDKLHPDVVEYLAELPSLRKIKVTERYLRGAQEDQAGLADIPKAQQLTELQKDISDRMCSRTLRRRESMRSARHEFMQSIGAGRLDL